eukprot:1778670-Prymnesium_polylepis.1
MARGVLVAALVATARALPFDVERGAQAVAPSAGWLRAQPQQQLSAPKAEPTSLEEASHRNNATFLQLSSTQQTERARVSSPVGAPNIMVLGDSFVKPSTLAAYCKGGTFTNRGVASSTAEEWASSATSCPAMLRQVLPVETQDRSCSAASAFSDGASAGYTHAWLSVGSNDKLVQSADCGLTAAALQQRVTEAIEAVQAAAPEGVRILMTGYCAPVGAVGGCTDPAALHDELNGAIAAACAVTGVTFVDAWGACGASNATFTPVASASHSDGMHVNEAGLCRLLTMPAMQAALGCEAATYDCSALVASAVRRPPGE